MSLSMRRVYLGAILAFLAIVACAKPQLADAAAADRLTRVPHNASAKVAREDLMEALRESGEVRVIVGMQTAADLTEPPDSIPDFLKEQRVNARQLRVLERLARHALRNVRQLRHHPFMAATVDAAALSALLADPEVSSVTEDRPVYPTLHETPIITRSDKAWDSGYRGGGQAVAIVDSGVDKNHPMFAGKVIAEACFSKPAGSNVSYCPAGVASSTASGSGVPCTDSNLGCWHGTHVAGIAAGRYGYLSSTTGGIGHEADVIAIQVFQRNCDANGCRILAYDSDLIRALDHVYSLRNTYKIAAVNMSVGGDVYTANCDASLPAYKTVIASLRSANIATVIAAGNNGNASGISAPACVSNAISVGSTTKQNGISSFSNSASFLSLLAPGSGILSSMPGGGYAYANGTSMATPHVAGAWAILKSAKPSATVDEVLSALQTKGLSINDSRNGVTKSLIQIGNTTAQTGALGVVLGNQAPTVTLTSPANNATFTAPASVNLSATAADPDGSVSKVEFYRDGTLIATVTTPMSGSYAFTDTNVAAGTYTYTAKAYDNSNPAAVKTSGSSLVTVNAPGTVAVNVAAQVNGGVASASSSYNAGYAPSSANNGDRKGLNWGNGGGWNDATANTFGDWLQVTFNGTYSISEIDVFTVQDNFVTPIDPTPTMTFTQWGSTAYQVQYWNGSAWLDVPGGNIVGNNLVWRRITFSPVSTNAIRVIVNNGLSSYARITEIEAWTDMTSSAPPTTSKNVAAQANGGIASASSSYNAGYAPSSANNGDRRGMNWGNGGGWNDATLDAFGDWLQVTFIGTYSIGEIDVFTIQDNYSAPVEPTSSMTFSQWGITAFQVQYWDGNSWLDVPGGNITGNNLVWRRITFAPITTNAVRVVVNSALNRYSRITEIEAWTN